MTPFFLRAVYISSSHLAVKIDHITQPFWTFSTMYNFIVNQHISCRLIFIWNQVTMKTAMGQAMDLLSAPGAGEKPDLSQFTTDKYSAIVKYKTAYYSFYLPVALAMHMVGNCLFFYWNCFQFDHAVIWVFLFIRLVSTTRIFWSGLKRFYCPWATFSKSRTTIWTVLVILKSPVK